jgi:PilZ domain
VAQLLKDRDVTGNEQGIDRRKAKRLFLNFSVELSGVDQEGQPFLERTKTEDISDTGCRLLTTIPVKCGDLLDIRLTTAEGTRLPEESALQFEIMWVHPTKSGWSIGTRQIQDGKIWKVSFPPPRASS